MTSLTTKLTIAAAALFAAGAASAQTLKADIPFAFQSGSKVMAAGTSTWISAAPRERWLSVTPNGAPKCWPCRPPTSRARAGRPS